MRPLRNIRPALVAVLAFGLVALSIPPKVEAGGGGRVRASGSARSSSARDGAREAAHRRLRRFERRTRGFTMESSARLGGKIAKTALAEGRPKHRKGPSRVVVRAPKDVERKIMKNSALYLLATELGMPELVPRAAPAGFRLSKRAAMLMEYVGSEFKSGERAPSGWLAKIPERTRLVGAVMDLLAEHRDRKMANLMISADGHVRLIDPDTTFGQGAERKMFISNFFPGRRVGFDASRYRTFAELPEEVRKVVSAIAEGSAADLQRFYGLDVHHVRLMRHRARRVVEVGLVEAIAELIADIERVGVRGDE